MSAKNGGRENVLKSSRRLGHVSFLFPIGHLCANVYCSVKTFSPFFMCEHRREQVYRTLRASGDFSTTRVRVPRYAVPKHPTTSSCKSSHMVHFRPGLVKMSGCFVLPHPMKRACGLLCVVSSIDNNRDGILHALGWNPSAAFYSFLYQEVAAVSTRLRSLHYASRPQ